MAAYRAGVVDVDYLPRVLCLEPTSACNFRCTSCPRPEVATTVDVAELGRWLDREPAPFTAAPVWVHFSGESLLHPRFEEVCRLLTDRGAEIMLSTNGSVLRGRRAEMVMRTGLSLIVFSLDAAREETYRQVRIGGDFAAVEANVRAFLRLRGAAAQPLAQVQMVLGDQSLDEVLEFVRRWADSDVDSISLKRYSTRGGRVAPADSSRVRPPGGATRCLDPWLNVVVRADGSVVPCCADFGGELVLGSLKESTLGEIWAGEPARRLRSAHATGEGLPLVCQRCSDHRSDADSESVTVLRRVPETVTEVAELLATHPRHLVFEVGAHRRAGAG